MQPPSFRDWMPEQKRQRLSSTRSMPAPFGCPSGNVWYLPTPFSIHFEVPRRARSSPECGSSDGSPSDRPIPLPSGWPRPKPPAAARSSAVPPSLPSGMPSARVWRLHRRRGQPTWSAHAAWPAAGGPAAVEPGPMSQCCPSCRELVPRRKHASGPGEGPKKILTGSSCRSGKANTDRRDNPHSQMLCIKRLSR